MKANMAHANIPALTVDNDSQDRPSQKGKAVLKDVTCCKKLVISSYQLTLTL